MESIVRIGAQTHITFNETTVQSHRRLIITTELTYTIARMAFPSRRISSTVL